jgi:hypothetical protein
MCGSGRVTDVEGPRCVGYRAVGKCLPITTRGDRPARLPPRFLTQPRSEFVSLWFGMGLGARPQLGSWQAGLSLSSLLAPGKRALTEEPVTGILADFGAEGAELMISADQCLGSLTACLVLACPDGLLARDILRSLKTSIQTPARNKPLFWGVPGRATRRERVRSTWRSA